MGGVQLSVKCVCVIVTSIFFVYCSAANLRTSELRQNVMWVDKCCDWLQQLCLTNIQTWAAKIILFHFRRGSTL